MSNPSPDELARALSSIEHRLQVSIAESAASTEAGTTRASDLSLVVRSAMRETARLAQLEKGLSAIAPSAAGRLRVLCDIGAVSFAKVVVDGTAREMLKAIDREDR